jgi:hypothetical protein
MKEDVSKAARSAGAILPVGVFKEWLYRGLALALQGQLNIAQLVTRPFNDVDNISSWWVVLTNYETDRNASNAHRYGGNVNAAYSMDSSDNDDLNIAPNVNQFTSAAAVAAFQRSRAEENKTTARAAGNAPSNRPSIHAGQPCYACLPPGHTQLQCPFAWRDTKGSVWTSIKDSTPLRYQWTDKRFPIPSDYPTNQLIIPGAVPDRNLRSQPPIASQSKQAFNYPDATKYSKA